ncbi:MAG: sarcosine oxidase gamma subunit [Phenylobacterium sp.]|nr:sarcosine oxidase gamma subunit [Phenylobacterium sp.]
MAETLSLAPAAALAVAPGRTGRLDGAPGVTVRLGVNLQIASVVARKEAGAALGARLAEAFGVQPPAGPARCGTDALAWLGVGPGRWLAVADGSGDLAGRLTQELGGLASVCDQSDGYAVVEVAGPAARRALAKGVALDLHPDVFAADAVAVTQIAHIGTVLWRTQDGERFRLAVFRSMAASFWRWLGHSAAEFGLIVEEPL